MAAPAQPSDPHNLFEFTRPTRTIYRDRWSVGPASSYDGQGGGMNGSAAAESLRVAMSTSTLPDAVLGPEPVEGLSSDLLLVRQDLATGQKPVTSWRAAGHVFDIVARGRSLWVIVSGTKVRTQFE